MTPTQQHATLAAANCQVVFDNLTRQLYATDASHYQIEPVAVAFPRDAGQASSIIQAAGHAGVSIIPRGAGTGLAGGAIGEGLVIDFSRYNRQITDFNPEKRTVRVGAGVVLDQLNDYLRPEGFFFAPDVATSARATIGGMIATNSSGARAPVYGTTADHLVELERSRSRYAQTPARVARRHGHAQRAANQRAFCAGTHQTLARLRAGPRPARAGQPCQHLRGQRRHAGRHHLR
ncbi:MAG: FAD-binding oxidoreductase [Verrucomicrobia bacterium]|nr:FAD-binding oxidoreductase [Verrucomicrobiota bacterium]